MSCINKNVLYSSRGDLNYCRKTIMEIKHCFSFLHNYLWEVRREPNLQTSVSENGTRSTTSENTLTTTTAATLTTSGTQNQLATPGPNSTTKKGLHGMYWYQRRFPFTFLNAASLLLVYVVDIAVLFLFDCIVVCCLWITCILVS